MSSAIQDIGLTLVALLRANLPDAITDEEIVLLSPVEALKVPGVRISLFLYSVAPAVELRNELEIPGNTASDEEVSMPLDLYYLLTVFTPPVGQNTPTERTLESHMLLGHAMRVFFDNGTLTGSLLRGELPREEELRLTLQPMTVEDLTRIWSVFPESVLHTSVSYLVTPVRLRSNRRRGGRPVVERGADVDHLVPTPAAV